MILRTQLWLGIVLLVGMAHCQDEDYGGDMGSASAGNSDDIYDPTQLEIEVETEMQQHRNSLDEEHTEGSYAMEQDMMSTMRPLESRLNTMAPYSEENTAAKMMEDAPTQKRVSKVDAAAGQSRDYYYDTSEDEMMASTTARVATTLIPEYVRQAKAERFPQREHQEHDISEYVEEEATKSTEEEHPPIDVTYQVEQQQPVPQAQVQVQQLPSSSKPQSFKYSTEDEYYDDPAEVKPHPTAATSEEPLPVLRARFGGFPWPSTTQAPGPVTAPATTSSASPVSTTIPTTTSPRKQAKHIHVPGGVKAELLPADQLRNYIKDVYIRMPLAVIVDPSSASLEQAKRLYIDALQDKNIDIKIVLVTLNGAGMFLHNTI